MTRGCGHCAAPFVRKRTEAGWRFKMRRYCSRRCYEQARGSPAGVVLARVKHVIAYDPELEVWQLAERFGVDVSTADNWRRRYSKKLGVVNFLGGRPIPLTTSAPQAHRLEDERA